LPFVKLKYPLLNFIRQVMKICFATQNQNKLKEVKQILGSRFILLGLSDLGHHTELEETGNTFEANSLQKALFVWEKYQIPCFADDSGLEVQALGGLPGVNSAFYAGEQKNYAANNALLLKNLEGKIDRTAQFRTCITLLIKGKDQQFNGIVRGKILTTQRGTNGFGYDPLFVPEGYEKTFAEMDSAEKNKISHRALAMQKLIDFLQKLD
jgi:XTP/dITP diphosphohydrolase